MRIKAIRIGRYGGSRDVTYQVSTGLNVFFGGNESGKTTTMEFIRNVMVPTTRRNGYPERTGKDEGSITYEEHGSDKVLRLDGRKVNGQVPDAVSGMDPDLYRGVFAMNLNDLNDESSVMSDDMKASFMPVPDGVDIPSVLSMLDDECDSLIGSSSRSRTDDVSKLESQISELKSNVEREKADMRTYGDLSSEREDLESTRSELVEAARRSREDVRRKGIQESNAENYRLLAEKKDQLSSLEQVPEVSSADVDRHRSLVGQVSEKKGAVSAHMGRRDSYKVGLHGADPAKVGMVVGKIGVLLSRPPGDREHLSASMSDSRQGRGRKVPSVLMVVGVVTALVGIAGISGGQVDSILSAAGAVMVLGGLIGLFIGRSSKKGNHVGGRANGSEDSYALDVSNVMMQIGLTPVDVEGNISILGEVRDAYRQYVSAVSDLEKARSELDLAEVELREFLSPFGGESGFQRCMDHSVTRRDLMNDISLLRRTIEYAGLDPDNEESAIGDIVDHSGELSDIDRRIGELTVMMDTLLDGRGLLSRMDELHSLVVQRDEALRRAAILIIARDILMGACDGVFGDVHPTVHSRAERYLSMMTGGRYSLNVDRDNGTISVVDCDGDKVLKRCSTGLRAQVMLSIKLATAYEMGRGEVPVILDDVLLPFDSERKRAALEALSELSDGMQILLFTCDRETSEICSDMDGITLVSM